MRLHAPADLESVYLHVFCSVWSWGRSETPASHAQRSELSEDARLLPHGIVGNGVLCRLPTECTVLTRLQAARPFLTLKGSLHHHVWAVMDVTKYIYSSTSIQFWDTCTLLEYFSIIIYFILYTLHSAMLWRQSFYFLLHYIYLTTLVTSYSDFILLFLCVLEGNIVLLLHYISLICEH